MEGLDANLIDEFLPSDYDLSANIFEDEFMLDQITGDDNVDFADELMIQGIKEDLESWEGGSSVSSSPTFSHQNASLNSDSDEEKYSATIINPYDFLRDVVVDQKVVSEDSNRDTPSPGSTASSSSGCISDFSCTTNETKIFPTTTAPVSAGAGVNILNVSSISPATIVQPPIPGTATNIQPILFQQVQCGNSIQYVQIPSIVSTPVPVTRQFPVQQATNISAKPIQIKPRPAEGIQGVIQQKPGGVNQQPKTVVLSSQDFGQLMKHMKVTKTAPTIQTVVAQGVGKPRAVEETKTVVHPPIDERTYKKQQRLIRNRESASLSRRKKKEYVDSLEEIIQEMNKDKEQLTNENNLLRNQLLNNVCSRCNQLVVVNSNAKVLRKPLSGLVTKKNSVLLLAMIFTVSLNFGPLNNMLSSTPPELINSALPDAQSSSVPGDASLRRHILWADETDVLRNESFVEGTNSTTPLEAHLEQQQSGNTSYPKCLNPSQQAQQYINQTDNIRITSELRRWIGEPEYLNSTHSGGMPSIMSSLDDVKKNFEYDGNFLDTMMPKKYLRNKKLQLRKNKKTERYPVDKKGATKFEEDAGQVDVFRPPKKIEMKYAELFAELRRRDDTFYVVSFNADHLMLPALAYNKTKRPKMSLMFPAVGFNESLNDDHILMMQIDCEVLDTGLIQVKEKLIPDHLRRFQNETATTMNESDASGGEAAQEFGPQLKRNGSARGAENVVRKPYFIENPRFDNRSANVGSEGGFN